MEKGGNIKEQMGNVHRDMKILRTNQKEMLKIKNGNEEEMKNVFIGSSIHWTWSRNCTYYKRNEC